MLNDYALKSAVANDMNAWVGGFCFIDLIDREYRNTLVDEASRLISVPRNIVINQLFFQGGLARRLISPGKDAVLNVVKDILAGAQGNTERCGMDQVLDLLSIELDGLLFNLHSTLMDDLLVCFARSRPSMQCAAIRQQFDALHRKFCRVAIRSLIKAEGLELMSQLLHVQMKNGLNGLLVSREMVFWQFCKKNGMFCDEKFSYRSVPYPQFQTTWGCWNNKANNIEVYNGHNENIIPFGVAYGGRGRKGKSTRPVANIFMLNGDYQRIFVVCSASNKVRLIDAINKAHLF